MSWYTFKLHRDAGYVSVHQGLELKYKLPYGGNRLTRGWTNHVLDVLIGKDSAYSLLAKSITAQKDIPDKKIGLLIPPMYHVSSLRPSLWQRVRNFFQL